jgi:hypothetical protein
MSAGRRRTRGRSSGWPSVSSPRSRAGSPSRTWSRPSAAERDDAQGLCPFHGEDRARGDTGRDTWPLRLRQARRHLHLPDGARRARVPGGAAGAGRQGRRGDRRADQARGRAPGPAAGHPRDLDRLLPPGPDRDEDGRACPGLPPRPRLYGCHDRIRAAGLGAGRLGHDDAQLARSARSRRASCSRWAWRARASAAAACTTGSGSE